MLQCTDIKKQPTANIIDGNVQLHIFSLIPDNFQGVKEIDSDSLPKPSKVNIVNKEKLIKFFGRSKILLIYDLRT